MNIDKNILKNFKRPIVLVVILPWLLYAIYLNLLASHMYESQSQLVLKSSAGESAFDPASLLLGGISGGSSTNDALLLQAFIQSRDILRLLDESLALRAHYTSDNADIFSRLSGNHSEEDFHAFFKEQTDVKVDQQSGVITIKTVAFEKDFAQRLNTNIIGYAETFINQINQELAKSKLEFANQEHLLIEKKLENAKAALLAFQSTYNLVDPTIEGAALQQITYNLEAALVQKKAELKAAEKIMVNNAPVIVNLKRDITALEQQINLERDRISSSNDSDSKSMSTLIAEYSNLRIQLELSTQAFAASLASLEKTRTETYQQLQYLVTLETSSLPDENRYPRVSYLLLLAGILLLLGFGIIRIVIATIREFSY
jgi:capsular polysaccharide transport system permease protein